MDTTIYEPIVIEKLWNKKRNEGDPVDYSTYFLNYQKTNLDAQLDVLTGVVKTGAMVGVGMGVTMVTGGIGVGPYLAGTGAVGGMSMALDSKVRHSLATGDWVGAMAHGSYHTPFIGNGRNAWEAWQMGKPWSAAGHAGLFSIEALGMRSAGKVRGIVRGTAGAGKAAKAAKVEGVVGRVNIPKSFSKRAPELLSGQIYEGEFLKTSEKFLGKGYKEISPGRYISKDGLRQIRYGLHEVESTVHHAHFEAYNHAGGKIIENARVLITD